MNTRFIRTETIIAGLFTIMALPCAAVVNLVSDPANIKMTSPTQSVVVKFTADGAPLGATDIRGWKLEANGFNYSNLIDVSNNAGELSITPTSAMVPGNYVLRVETERGTIVVPIAAPLTPNAAVAEQRRTLVSAANQNILQHFGGTTVYPEKDVSLGLLPTYYEGQTITLSVAPSPAETFTWFVNGAPVSEMLGGNGFTYTFPEAGYYAIVCLAWHAAGAQTVISMRGSGETDVVAYPGVAYTAKVNDPVTLPGPVGYTDYLWRVDGAEVSGAAGLVYTFTTLGAHTVECNASTPIDGVTDKFVRVVYTVTVVP